MTSRSGSPDFFPIAYKQEDAMNGPRESPCSRDALRPGIEVEIVLKQDQRTGTRTRGIVSEILTNSRFHPHGIKVRLRDGRVGRVAAILHKGETATEGPAPSRSSQKPGPDPERES